MANQHARARRDTWFMPQLRNHIVDIRRAAHGLLRHGVMEPLEWSWSIVASVQNDGTVGLSVEAGGRRLLPVGHRVPPLEALPCVMSVITPFAPNDTLSIEVRTSAERVRQWQGSDSGAAMRWLSEVLAKTCDYRHAFEPPRAKITTGVYAKPVRRSVPPARSAGE